MMMEPTSCACRRSLSCFLLLCVLSVTICSLQYPTRQHHHHRRTRGLRHGHTHSSSSSSSSTSGGVSDASSISSNSITNESDDDDERWIIDRSTVADSEYHSVVSNSSLEDTQLPRRKILVLLDGFSDHVGGYCRSLCYDRGIETVDLVSEYLQACFRKQSRSIPSHLQCPLPSHEVAWATAMGLMDKYRCSSDDDDDKMITDAETNVTNQLFIISESESGTSTAERMQVALGLPGNGISPQLRNKYLSNVMAKEDGGRVGGEGKGGIDVVRQKLAHTWKEASDFIAELWRDCDNDDDNDGDNGGDDGGDGDALKKKKKKKQQQRCVVKPYRGVASDGVFCCSSLIEAQGAFHALIGQPQYGGGVNDAVLIQEYADGTEYAVDTVARDGQIKVIAIWKYAKFSANGAPFVYQCSELVSADGEVEAKVCDYCVDVLKAQRLRWGPTHTEIKFTTNGPRLMEINARWHAQGTTTTTYYMTL